jgi:hypothetical protein
MINKDWITKHPTSNSQIVPPGGEEVELAVERLKALLSDWALGFSERRPDVGGAGLSFGIRGVRQDEAAAFLRAIDSGIINVDDAGYVRCIGTQQKSRESIYCLFGKNGAGVALHTEYLIHFGAAGELVTYFGWPSDRVLVEVGEFDAAVEIGLQTIIAMEAKARVEGSDGLSRLMESFLKFAESPQPPVPNDNHSRKYVDLVRRCAEGPVILWLVADSARWTFNVSRNGSKLQFAETPISYLNYLRKLTPDLHEAIELSSATEIDGEQRAYPYNWDSIDELSEFIELLKPKIIEKGLLHSRPWRWYASTSDGEPLTNAGKKCGLELRFSWYA